MEAKYPKTSRIAPPTVFMEVKIRMNAINIFPILLDIEFCKELITNRENTFCSGSGTNMEAATRDSRPIVISHCSLRKDFWLYTLD